MIAILLLIVAVLLLFAVREGFAATATIKNPNSWNAEEYARIKALVPGTAFTDAEIQDIVGGMWSVWSDATRPITMGQLTTYMDRKPEYTTRKAAAVNLLKAYYIDQFDYQFAGGHSEVVTTPATTPPVASSGSGTTGGTGGDVVDALCPDGSTPGGMVPGAPGAPVGQCSSTGQMVTCPSGFTLFLIGAPGSQSMKCVRNFSTYAADFSQGPPPRCTSASHLLGRSVLPSGRMDGDFKCIVVGGTGGPPPVTPSGGSSGDSTTADVGTTGGSSNSLGPTNIPAGTKGARVVYGPEWKGLGEGGLSGGDSTSTRSYPVLLGPEPVASTRIDGVGVVAPSQNYLLGISGMLPSADSLGAGELSRFLPFSRPTAPNAGVDPWRVASAFSTASYSQKTDPVPFLADFSAFQR